MHTIAMMKSERMKWEGNVASVGRRGMHIRFWLENQKEGDHYNELQVGGRIILKWILDRSGRYGLDSSG
jgi:hypothetical protein